MYRYFTIASLLALLSLFPAVADDSEPAMATATNSFTFRLISTMGVPQDKNFMVSPFSVSYALGMLVPGMQSADQRTMLGVIAPRMNAQNALSGYSQMNRDLTADGTLSVANSVWVDRRVKLQPSYKSAVRKTFQVGVFPFGHNEASVESINKWVDAKTRNHIPKILDMIKDADRLIVINAVAFDGKWAKQFDKSRTFPQDFHARGNTARVPMMHMNEKVSYYKSNTIRAIKLNYAKNNFSMIVILPEEGTDASGLLAKMGTPALDHIVGSMDDSEKVEITLPKFRFSDSHQLAQGLSGMGLAKFFNEVDFSKISPSLLRGRIDRVIHKTFIQVDEAGTKAAAATGVTVQPTMVRVDRRSFVADRPFDFFIMHNKTHAILFAGVVNKP